MGDGETMRFLRNFTDDYKLSDIISYRKVTKPANEKLTFVKSVSS